MTHILTQARVGRERRPAARLFGLRCGVIVPQLGRLTSWCVPADLEEVLMSPVNRREFLAQASVAAGAAMAVPAARARQQPTPPSPSPVAVASANGLRSVEIAYKRM